MQNRYPNGLTAKLAAGVRVVTDLAKRGAALARGPNEGNKLPGAPWSQTWPAPGATLDLDFANDRGFVRGVGQGRSMDAVTFTRASNGNWVDSAGVLRTGAGTFPGTANALGVNLLTFPQDFDNAAWTKFQTTVTANATTAPDGTPTADLLLETAVNNFHRIVSPTVTKDASAAAYTTQIFFKPNGRNRIALQLQGDANNGVYCIVEGSGNGAVVVGATTFGSGWVAGTATISATTNGFYSVVLSGTSNTLTTIYSQVFLVLDGTTTTSYQGDGTSGIFIWGAQLELGSSATTYYPTNINVPRFDWASTAQTTPTAGVYTKTEATANSYNLLTYSEQFDNAAWLKTNSSVLADQTTAPDGTVTAEKHVPNNGSTLGIAAAQTPIYRGSTGYSSSGRTIALSIYAKKAEFDRIAIFWSDQTNVINCVFNLNDGSLVSQDGIGTATSQSVGNGWYRCSIVYLMTGAGNSVNGLRISAVDSSATTGNGTSGIFIWGAQLEQSVPTTPLLPASTCNGLLIEESRANRILWCRDATSGTGTNTLQRSEEFDNSYWSKVASSITATNSTTAPDGTSTADTWTIDSTNSQHYFQVNGGENIVSGVAYTRSLYVKKINQQYIQFGVSSGAFGLNVWATFDLDNGTVVASGSAGTYSITAANNGFYRISLTAIATGTVGGAGNWCGFTNNINTRLPTFTGNGTDAFYIWGAQAVSVAVLTDYQATTSAALFGWSKATVTLAKNQTGVDNVANAATSITATAANGTLIQPISLASGSRTASVYLKRITGTGNVQVSLDGSTWSTVDLSSTEWRRIVLSGTVTNPVVGIRLATNGDAVAMDYAQVEDGAFATTPILTTTASATRSADTATNSGINFASWFKPDGGSFYCDSAIGFSVSASTNTTTNSFRLNLGSFRVYVASSAVVDQSLTSIAKVSAGLQAFDYAFATDISTVRTQKSGAFPSGLSILNIGLSAISGATYINNTGTIKRITFFPKRLSDDGINNLPKAT